MSKNIVEIKGFDELERKIKQLGNDKDKRREVLSILRKTARPTVNAAKRFVKVSKKPHLSSGKRSKKIIQPGNLKSSIGTITGRKGNAKKNPTIYVGPRVKGKHDGFYGAWLEEGHNIYKKGFKRNRKGKSKYNNSRAKSKTQAYPFMEPAYKTTKGKVTLEAEKSTAKFIQRRINKLSN